MQLRQVVQQNITYSKDKYEESMLKYLGFGFCFFFNNQNQLVQLKK